MESGIYVTFLTAGEPPNRELPPVGPLDHVVMRQQVLLAERRSITQAEELGVSTDRWFEAELELQRAMGQEPSPAKRIDRRFAAWDGVYLRFVAFGEVYERDPVPELGPFAVVVVGAQSVDADGKRLAERADKSWTLTAACGSEFAGTRKTDIAFRTANSAYHQSVARVTAKPVLTASAPSSFAPDPPAAAPSHVNVPPPAAAPPPIFIEPQRHTAPPPPIFIEPQRAAAPPPPVFIEPEREAAPPPPVFVEQQRETPAPAVFIERQREAPVIYSPQAASSAPVPEQSEADRALLERLERDRMEESLRTRIQGEARRKVDVDESEGAGTQGFAARYRAQPAADATESVDDDGLQWGAALWRLRFLVIGVLVLLVGGYSFVAVRNAANPGPSGPTYVALAQKFSSARWDYTVNGVSRSTSAALAQPRGEYYVVRIAATNRGTENLQTSPGDFTLYDANGNEYRAESLNGGVYQTPENPRSPYPWPSAFPIGRTVTFTVVFDIPLGLPHGMLLGLFDLPNTRVKLD